MRHRHQIPIIGERGQDRLAKANVLIVGVGALGSVVAELLCRAGVGTLTLYDFDIIEESNLQRQALYTTNDIGRFKVDAAKEHLIAIDPNCLIKAVNEPFTGSVALDEFDIIIDGTDSLDARLLLNDAAKKGNKPLVIGAVAETQGMLFVVNGSPCWQCITHGKIASDDCDSGVLGSTTHAIASLQAAAAIRTLLGQSPQGLCEIDVWTQELRRITVPQNPACSACKGEYKYLVRHATRFCQSATKMIAQVPKLVDLDALRAKHEVIRDYGSALLIKLGNGEVLVHRHGNYEFSGVDEHAAKRLIE